MVFGGNALRTALPQLLKFIPVFLQVAPGLKQGFTRLKEMHERFSAMEDMVKEIHQRFAVSEETADRRLAELHERLSVIEGVDKDLKEINGRLIALEGTVSLQAKLIAELAGHQTTILRWMPVLALALAVSAAVLIVLVIVALT